MHIRNDPNSNWFNLDNGATRMQFNQLDLNLWCNADRPY